MRPLRKQTNNHTRYNKPRVQYRALMRRIAPTMLLAVARLKLARNEVHPRNGIADEMGKMTMT